MSASGVGPPAPPTTLALFGRRVRVGTLALAAVLALVVAGAALAGRHPAAAAVRDVALAGFVGGLAVALAHRLPYQRIPLVPGSGLLLDRRAAIEAAIADAVAAQVADPARLERGVRALASRIEPEGLARAANQALDALRPELVAFIDSPAQRERLRAMVRRRGGRLGEVANAFGVVSYDAVVGRIVDAVVEEVRAFRVEPRHAAEALARVGPLDALVLERGHPLAARIAGPERSLAERAIAELDVRRRVLGALSGYGDDAVRATLARRVGEPATWLEVFGIGVGVAVGVVAELLALVG